MLALAWSLGTAGSATAVTITEFSSGISAGSQPHGIAAGPDGNLWFTEPDETKVGRITPHGVVTEFSAGITPASGPYAIAAGPDGDMWFTERGAPAVGSISPAGVVSEFGTGDAQPIGTIAAGPDGRLWFPARAGADSVPAVAAISTSGAVSVYADGLSEDSAPRSIAAGPDGNLWFTDVNGRIGRITPAGEITEMDAGLSANSMPWEIAAGPDGNLWFTESNGPRIGRITPAGVITEFSTGLSPNGRPRGIAAGPDGNLWFTELSAHKIGRITPAGVVTVFSEGITATAGPTSIAPTADSLWYTDTGGRIGRVTVFEAPVVTTSAPTEIEANAATLQGTVDPRETTTSARFDYGVTTAYGTSTPEQTFEGASAAPASATLTGLQPDTTYHFRLVATSSQGTGESSGTFTTLAAPPSPDTTPPGTTIDSGPPARTAATTADFAASSEDAAADLRCALDGAPYAPCPAPLSYSALGDGEHTLLVRAADAAGNVDPSPAGHSWTVDTTAPTTSIDSGPADPTADTTASFGLSSDDPLATFQCDLDGAGFGACPSPAAYAGLAAGAHTLRVRAVDDLGNADASPASRSWAVEAAQPAPMPLEPPAALAPLAPLPALAPRPVVPAAGRLSLVVAARGRVRNGRVQVGCRLDTGALASCAVIAFAGNRRVGTARRSFAGGRLGALRVKLTAHGLRLARRSGGVRLTYRATAATAGGHSLRAKASSRVLGRRPPS